MDETYVWHPSEPTVASSGHMPHILYIRAVDIYQHLRIKQSTRQDTSRVEQAVLKGGSADAKSVCSLL